MLIIQLHIAGGVEIPHTRGCVAHSDGDVLLHTVTGMSKCDAFSLQSSWGTSLLVLHTSVHTESQLRLDSCQVGCVHSMQ